MTTGDPQEPGEKAEALSGILDRNEELEGFATKQKRRNRRVNVIIVALAVVAVGAIALSGVLYTAVLDVRDLATADQRSRDRGDCIRVYTNEATQLNGEASALLLEFVVALLGPDPSPEAVADYSTRVLDFQERRDENNRALDRIEANKLCPPGDKTNPNAPKRGNHA